MGTWPRRCLGLLLLAFVALPAHRILDRPETGSFGEGMFRAVDAIYGAMGWGLMVVAGPAVVLAILADPSWLRSRLRRLGDGLGAVPGPTFALLVGALAGGLALAASKFVFLGYPTLMDGIAALVHGRYLAEGALAGPRPSPAAGWMLPNTVLVANGWLSQYPPFHPLLLAAGLAVGAPWLVNPLLTGVLVAAATAAAIRLLPERAVAARAGGLAMALSPFVLFLGGGYLSHVPTAAFSAVVLYAALRARDGSWTWSLATGVAVGCLVTTRPYIGLVLGSLLSLGVWLPGIRRRAPSLAWLGSRLGGAFAGGLPFALALAAYNAHFFGHPLRLGYSVAYGPSHGLGFHPDPWGNVYGPWEAVGYTGASLLSLGTYLWETPLPVVALVGAYLLVARRLSAGERILLAWALLPVVANAFYWHHGFSLGPRMLYEAAPAWILLTAVAAVSLTTGPSSPAPLPRRVLPRDVLLWGMVVAVPISLFQVALRARSYAWQPATLARLRVPTIPASTPALIFVHGTWAERVAAGLQGDGMRPDSLETALRRNSLCAVQRFLDARTDREPLDGRQGAVGGLPPPEVDFEPLPGVPARIVTAEIGPGNRIKIDPREGFPPECRRQAAADRFGVVSLAPLVWQGDLPGIDRGRPLFVRDLGPDANRAVLDRHPGRVPYLLVPDRPEGDPRLKPYTEGEVLLWGSAEAR